jgi:hypothetical protein
MDMLASADDYSLHAAWVIYPLQPFQNATNGDVAILSATPSGSTAYSVCGTTSLAGVYPTSSPWLTPTVASQATITPVSIKTDFGSADNTGTTEGGHKIKRIDSPTGLAASETIKPVSAIAAGPGRRQLTGI